MDVVIAVNGRNVRADVPVRMLLVEFIRQVAELPATNVGCDTTSCGTCTVRLDGWSAKSCTILAVQADGSSVTTIEGLAGPDGLHPVQAAFTEHHALQCGFCTPGMVMAAVCLLEGIPHPDEAQVRRALKGNLCRCTGYHNIVAAILAASVPTTEDEN